MLICVSVLLLVLDMLGLEEANLGLKTTCDRPLEEHFA